MRLYDAPAFTILQDPHVKVGVGSRRRDPRGQPAAQRCRDTHDLAWTAPRSLELDVAVNEVVEIVRTKQGRQLLARRQPNGPHQLHLERVVVAVIPERPLRLVTVKG